MKYSLIFYTFGMDLKILGNIMWNVVSPTKHCYGFEQCYVDRGPDIEICRWDDSKLDTDSSTSCFLNLYFKQFE